MSRIGKLPINIPEKVQVTLDNDDTVSLKKTATEAFYQINKEDPYRKFGVGVSNIPDRISQKLNFSLLLLLLRLPGL